MFMLGAGLVALGLAAGLILLPKSEPSPERLSVTPRKVSFPSPDLSLVDLQGNPSALADWLGYLTLVNNWATWCPPCREEMPDLEAYYQAHKDQEFILIGIEAGEPADVVSSFVEETGLTFPIWLDPLNDSLYAFKNQNLPNSYVIDRSGTVRLAWTGLITLNNLEKYVTPLLEE